MGNAVQIIEICSMLVDAVQNGKSSEAKGEIEFGEGSEGITLEITCPRTEPKKTTRKKTSKARRGSDDE